MTNENNFKRLSPEEEQGRAKGGRILQEATNILGNYSITGRENQGTNYDLQKQTERKILIDFADQNNLWFEDHSWFGTYIDQGDEQKVFVKPEEMMVYKYNDLSFHDSYIEFFDRISIHNYLFPEAIYEVLGFTYNQENILCVVVKQPFVVCERGAYREEVIEEMAKMSYSHLGGTTFYNEDYIVEDLHPGNVLKLHSGKMAFIDPVIYLNTPEQDLGGTRII